MKKLIRCGALTVLLAASPAASASAGELKLTIGNGRATLIAQNVPLRQIVTEWERVGRTTIVNGDKMTGPDVTVELVDRPEREVLEVILRSASGYVVATRAPAVPGASMFDRVMVLATSRAPVGSPTPPAPFNNRPNLATPVMPMRDLDEDEPIESPNGPIAPPMLPPSSPGAPGQIPSPNAPYPGPMTSPRPGMLPAPQPGQPNPYSPMLPQGSKAPGDPGDDEPF